MQVIWVHAKRSLTLLVAALSAVLFVSAPVSAHSQLLSSSPAPGDTIATPSTVTLVFNEALIEVGTELSVTDASGAVFTLAGMYPEPPTLSAELPRLADGPAQIAWRVVSADGHPIEGVIDVTVANPPEPSPSPSPIVTEEPVATPSPEPTPSFAPAPVPDAAGGVPSWLWLALLVVVLAAAALAVIARRR